MKNFKDEIFLSLGAPARRALESAGIKEPSQLTFYAEAQILKLHETGRLPFLSQNNYEGTSFAF
jgi:hypothetical protein